MNLVFLKLTEKALRVNILKFHSAKTETKSVQCIR